MRTLLILSIFLSCLPSFAAPNDSVSDKFPLRCEVSENVELKFIALFNADNVHSIGIRYASFNSQGEVVNPMLNLNGYRPVIYKKGPGIIKNKSKLIEQFEEKLTVLIEKGICIPF